MSAAAMPMSCPTTAELIAAVQRADSSQGLLLATQALAACPDPAAASTLVEVLGFNNPGAAVDGLIGLGPGAVDALLQLDPENYGARAWAVRALAGIGDVRGLELLVDALGTDVAGQRAPRRGQGPGGFAAGGSRAGPPSGDPGPLPRRTPGRHIRRVPASLPRIPL